MGNDPQLPAAQQLPRAADAGAEAASAGRAMRIPMSPAACSIEKIAGGLMHPRQLLAMPNGDVLVVESNGPGTEAVTTPKQLIAGFIKNRSGKGDKGGRPDHAAAQAGRARARGKRTSCSSTCTRRSASS